MCASVWLGGEAGYVEKGPFEVHLGDLDGSRQEWSATKAFWMKGKERSGDRGCSSSVGDEVQWHDRKTMVFRVKQT